MTIDDIKNMLEEGFKLDHCEVINESPNHSNYSGDLSHIKIISHYEEQRDDVISYHSRRLLRYARNDRKE